MRGGGAAGGGSAGTTLGAKSSPDSGSGAHTGLCVRRCKDCLIRKVLEVGFYRERTCREGYRPECRRCFNRARAERARRRYEPRTGRRYLIRRDRAEAAARGPEASR
jgi:hypothetical protein